MTHYEREGAMRTSQEVGDLTTQERHLMALLRQGPQSVNGLAEALRLSPEQTQDVLQSLDRKVGIVPLFRYDTLRYGLAE
jgi:predicted ArsR family transcriptional regulator